MARAKGKTLDQYAPKSLQECLDIPHRATQLAAEAMMTGEELSVEQLAVKMRMSRASAKTQLDFLGQHKLVYLFRWDKTHSHNWTAMFIAGDKPHAPSPNMKNALTIKKPEPPPEPPKPPAPPPPPSYFQELSRALIPERDEQAKREANWMYWKYLAGEAA